MPVHGHEIRTIQPPVNRRLESTSAWVNMLTGLDRSSPRGWAEKGWLTTTKISVMETTSRLQRALQAGAFAVTAELSPPDSCNPDHVWARAAELADVVDAINVPDASGANVHLSPLATAALLADRGYEPVFQIACRDRNRIALQADLLGAAALGIRNLLCLTGDDVTNGDHPEAKRVFDLDSIQLLRNQ